MTYVRAAPDGAFKRCCLNAGRYDGSVRNYYFQGMRRQRRGIEKCPPRTGWKPVPRGHIRDVRPWWRRGAGAVILVRLRGGGCHPAGGFAAEKAEYA
jgi:hypothetical protein